MSDAQVSTPKGFSGNASIEGSTTLQDLQQVPTPVEGGELGHYEPKLNKPGNVGFLGSLIGGIAGLGSSIIGAFTANRRMKKEHQYRELEAENDLRRQVELFNHQAYYNSPLRQRERMEDAGLSKLAMVEKGGSFAGGQQVMPTAPNPGHMTSNYGLGSLVAEGVQGSLDSFVKMAQAKDLNASADLKSKQTVTETFRANLVDLEGVTERLKQTGVNLQNELLVITKWIQDNTRDDQVLTTHANRQHAEAAVDHMWMQIRNGYKQGRLTDAQARAAFASALESACNVALFDARAGLLWSQGRLNDAMVQNILAVTKSHLLNNGIIEYMMTGGNTGDYKVKKGSATWFQGQGSKASFLVMDRKYKWMPWMNISEIVNSTLDNTSKFIGAIKGANINFDSRSSWNDMPDYGAGF